MKNFSSTNPTMQQPKYNSQAGFTLLEVLIAIALMATIITVLFGLFTNVIDASQHARTRMEFDRVGRVVLTIIAEDIRYMRPDATTEHLKFNTSITPNETYQPEEKAIMGFATTSSLKFSENSKSYSLQYVTYTIVKDDSGRYTLFRIEKQFPTLAGDFAQLKYELVTGMLSCKFSHYDAESDAFTTEWGIEKKTLPKGIRIEFSLGDAENPHPYSLVIPLPENKI